MEVAAGGGSGVGGTMVTSRCGVVTSAVSCCASSLVGLRRLGRRGGANDGSWADCSPRRPRDFSNWKQDYGALRCGEAARKKMRGLEGRWSRNVSQRANWESIRKVSALSSQRGAESSVEWQQISLSRQGLTSAAALASVANTESIRFCGRNSSSSSWLISSQHLPQFARERTLPSASRLWLREIRGRCLTASASSSIVTAALARAEPVYTPEVEKLLETIKWDSKGLVVAIAQHVDTGAILMQGFANREAIAATIASNHATFFSRSRSSLWTKGESSRNFINVVDVYLDCDRDSIIYLGSPEGPTCHTGAETCYYTSAADFETSTSQALTTLYSLEATIAQRKAEISAKPSWTKKLIGNSELLCSKIREEADELCRTVENNEGRERTVSEMADVLYHTMVLLAVQDVKVQEVLEVLRSRFSKSGIEEKSNRSTKS